MTGSPIYLSVVVPAFNEEDRVAGTISSIDRYMKSRDYRYEIILVDDGSSDGTVKVAESLLDGGMALRVLRNGENRGKGYSVKNGFLHSGGEMLLFTDADLSTPIEEVERLLAHVRDGCDIAIGSRGLADSRILVRQPWYRESMGKTFNRLVRFIALKGITDTQCGFKLFHRKCALEICGLLTIDRFGFDVEMLYIALKKKYTVVEVPVIWINSANSKVNAWKDPFRMFIDLFLIRMNDFKGVYG